MVIFSLSPLRARKSDNYLDSDSWKSNNFKERAIKRKQKTDTKKGLRVKTLQEAIKKSPIYIYRNIGQMNDWMAP